MCQNPKAIVMKNSPADLLQESVDIFRKRNELYGDNYKKFGAVMHALFPNELQRSSEAAVGYWNRLGILVQIVSKLTRYCENFNEGGHDDSLKDLSVYAAMLRELDKEGLNDEIPF